MQLAGSVVIVTGASAGIGAATARALAQRGAQVVLRGRGGGRRAGRAAAWAAYPGGRRVLPGDIQDPAYCRQLVETSVAHFGRLDVLINNAGLGHRSPISRITPLSARAIFNTNVLGLLDLTQAALPHLLRQGRGQIINISSIVSQRPLVDNGVYAASKSAVNFISRALRMELDHLQRGELPDQEADGRRYQVVNDRQPGENRAAHRARLKRERREAKASKVPA